MTRCGSSASPPRPSTTRLLRAQHELAPIFTDVQPRDRQQPAHHGDMMKTIASHYGLVCLLHEKPFEGINGSGKHNNWSIATDKLNLLDPGKTPMGNLRFLVFLTRRRSGSRRVSGPASHARLPLRAMITALVQTRLRPAIISIFLGRRAWRRGRFDHQRQMNTQTCR